MIESNEEDLPLQRLMHWSQQRTEAEYLVQPLADDQLQVFSWGEVAAAAQRIGAFLRSQAYPAGSQIALFGRNSAWWFMADFAIWMAGHVSVPIYANFGAASVRQILQLCDARACFLGAIDDPTVAEQGIPADIPVLRLPQAPPVPGVEWETLCETAPLADYPLRGGDELATIIYTSGTTGVPKGVMHSFASMGTAGRLLCERMGGTVDDRLISYLPLAHVADRWTSEMFSLAAGCRVYFSSGLERFAEDLRRARPTLFGSVPRLWAKLQAGVFATMPKAQLDAVWDDPQRGPAVKRGILERLGLDAVRHAATGTAATPEALAQWYRELGLELIEVYGLSENFALSHIAQPGRGRAGYTGMPWPGTEVKFSAAGEVLVKSPCNMLGYFKQPELTAEALDAEGFLHTGDLGEADAEQRLRLSGRIKEIFKTSKGKYVAPGPIERRLNQWSDIDNSLVTGPGLPQPIAVLRWNAGGSAVLLDDSARLALSARLAQKLDALNAELDRHERLDFVVLVVDDWSVASGALTPTLKLRRAILEAHYAARFEAWAARGERVIWA